MTRKKELSYYKSLKYNIRMEKEFDDGEYWYIVYCDEFGRGACFGLGDDPTEAYNDFIANKEDYINQLYFNNYPIPEPKENINFGDFSGTFNVRTSPQMHSLLSKQARENNLSLNQYINQILTQASALNEVKGLIESKFNILSRALMEHDSNVSSKFIEYDKSGLQKNDIISGEDYTNPELLTN